MIYELIQKTKKHTESHRRYNRGSSMIVAIIVMAVVIIFTFSLLLVTYTLYASQSKKVASLKCSEAANSLSVALEKELTDSTAYEKSWLWNYLRFNLMRDDTWPFYVDEATSGHGHAEADRYFNFKYNKNYYPVEGFPGEIVICMYWELPNELSEGVKSELISGDKKLCDLTVSQKNNVWLNVEVTCNTGSQSYTVMNKYKIDIGGYSSTYEDTQMQNTVSYNLSSRDYNPLGLQEGIANYTSYIESERWEFKLDSRE